MSTPAVSSRLQTVALPDGLALVPVATPHYEFLYDLAHVDPQVTRRFRGAVPGFEDFVRGLGPSALSQFVVTEHGDPAGWVVAYASQVPQGTVRMGVSVAPDRRGRGIGRTAGTAFVRHTFASFALRKVYFEVVGANPARIEAPLRVEAALPAHEYVDGELRDLLVLALYRADVAIDGNR